MEDNLYFTREQAAFSAEEAAKRIMYHKRIVELLPETLDRCRVDWSIQEDAIFIHSVEEAELTQVRILLRADGWVTEPDLATAGSTMPEVWRAYKPYPFDDVSAFNVQIVIARLQSASEMLAESKGMVTVFQDGLWNRAGGQEVFSDDN